MKDYRRVFDAIPDAFDKYRPRYCEALFSDLTAYAGLGPGTSVLELGPGTGQATEPILKTGCDYLAIELGEHLAAKMQENFGSYPNFRIVNDDFVTHDFGGARFDAVCSASAIQWIPEDVAFPKVLSLLKPGGVLAMMYTLSDYRAANGPLYEEIQKVYREHFRPESEYKDMHPPFSCEHATAYGFIDLEKREFHGRRVFSAEEYAAFCGTHSDHIVIPEPYKSKFFAGLREAVLRAGDRIVFDDTYVLYLTRKPASCP